MTRFGDSHFDRLIETELQEAKARRAQIEAERARWTTRRPQEKTQENPAITQSVEYGMAARLIDLSGRVASLALRQGVAPELEVYPIAAARRLGRGYKPKGQPQNAWHIANGSMDTVVLETGFTKYGGDVYSYFPTKVRINDHNFALSSGGLLIDYAWQDTSGAAYGFARQRSEISTPDEVMKFNMNAIEAGLARFVVEKGLAG